MADTEGWDSLTTALVIGVFTLVLFYLWRTYRYLTTFSRMGIPGPRPLPFVGNMIPFLKESSLEVTQRFDKEYGKVYGIFFPVPTLVVTDKELAREILTKKFSSFADRNDLPGFTSGAMKDSLLSIKGDHWKHVRKQLSPTFSSYRLKQIVPVLSKVADNLRLHLEDKAKAGQMVELKELCQNIMVDCIAGVAFGLEVDSLKNPDDPFYRHSDHTLSFFNKMMGLLMAFPSLEPLLRLFGIHAFPQSDMSYLVSVINAALEDRRQDKQKYADFLQLLVEAEKAGSEQGQVDADIDFTHQLKTSSQWTRKGLTLSEIHANSITFLLAGNEQVSSVMSLTLFAMAANPHCFQKAREQVDLKMGKGKPDYDSVMDLTYLDMYMSEAIRYYVPGMLMRVATEDVDLGAYHVPKGMQILIPSCVMHHDPQEWSDPDVFDPERHAPENRGQRDQVSFLPFGQGPRSCIGIRLAQLEIRLILATVLQHFTPVLCEKSVVPPVMMPLTVGNTRDGLWVRFEPRADTQ